MGWDVRDNPKPAPGPLALVQDFVNTRNYFDGGDLLEDAGEATARLIELGLLGEGGQIGDPERRASSPSGRALGAAPGSQRLGECRSRRGDLERPDRHLHVGGALRARGAPGPGARGPGRFGRPVMARLLAVAVRAEAEVRWGRMKACRNEGCRWAFYDASKNRSGSWCNMQVCGARHKMRAYRRRKAGA